MILSERRVGSLLQGQVIADFAALLLSTTGYLLTSIFRKRLLKFENNSIDSSSSHIGKHAH